MRPRSLQEAAQALKPLPRTPQPRRPQGEDAPGSRDKAAAELTQSWALTQPRAVYREMLPSKVWAEDPTGVKDREAAALLLLRDTLDHMSQRKRDPGILGCLICQPLDWNVKSKKVALGSLLKSLQLFSHTGNFPWGS